MHAAWFYAHSLRCVVVRAYGAAMLCHSLAGCPLSRSAVPFRGNACGDSTTSTSPAREFSSPGANQEEGGDLARCDRRRKSGYEGTPPQPFDEVTRGNHCDR